MGVRRVAAFVVAALACVASAQQHPFRLPTNAPPRTYGNVLINRTTHEGPVKPAVFSHWLHRTRYTCRVCHLELDFAFMRNATEITEDANRRGAYCGACHDGRTAFACAEESSCARCHTGDVESGSERFMKAVQDLPFAAYGNGVDWTRALANGSIKPATSLDPAFKPMILENVLTLEAEWNFVSAATFPHAEHSRLLDCANCHPAPFNIEKKTTSFFSMRTILAGQFCGVCHLRVAFPVNDCRRCHPDMKDRPAL